MSSGATASAMGEDRAMGNRRPTEKTRSVDGDPSDAVHSGNSRNAALGGTTCSRTLSFIAGRMVCLPPVPSDARAASRPEPHGRQVSRTHQRSMGPSG